MVFQDTINLAPQEQGATDISDLIRSIIVDSKIKIGTCQLFVHHSMSGLLISDTVDESTKSQTADFLAQLAPRSDSANKLVTESMHAIPEVMRAVLTQHSISFPVSHGKPMLGIWQGIYLWEKTVLPEARKLTITIIGE